MAERQRPGSTTVASLRRREPDFEQFLKVLRRRGMPNHLPFYEHIASEGFIARFTNTPFDKLVPTDSKYWRTYVRFWLELGFDCIPIEIPLNLPLPEGDRSASRGSEARAVIHDESDYECYPWPPLSSPLDFRPFETVAKLMPDGAKMVAGVCMGPFEWVSTMMGVNGLSLALYRQPALVERMFDRIGALIENADRQLASMDGVGTLRQGDDLGFKTSTFLSPAHLRRYVIPWYARMARIAHDHGKPFVLHSCGNLATIYDDLIDAGVDAKHSFEEAILPVEQFKQRYGDRVTPLGGLDVDVLCRGSEERIRQYTRKKVEQCYADGHWALGTGNSLTNYLPVENYLIALDEGLRASS
jgi:uroporphyrinogen decarboxylase